MPSFEHSLTTPEVENKTINRIKIQAIMFEAMLGDNPSVIVDLVEGY